MENQEYTKLKEWIKSVDDKLDNHLVGIGKEIAEIKTDLKWLKKFFWIVMTSSIGAVILVLFNLIFK